MSGYSREYSTFMQKEIFIHQLYIYVCVIVGFILYFSSQNATPIQCAGIHSHGPSQSLYLMAQESRN